MEHSLRVSPAARDLTKAPPLPAWPPNLPKACLVLQDGECLPRLDVDAVCLPGPRAYALDYYLATVEENQGEAQLRINEGWHALEDFKREADIRHKRDVEAVAALGWKDWEVAGVAVGALLTGALVAGLTVYLIH